MVLGVDPLPSAPPLPEDNEGWDVTIGTVDESTLGTKCTLPEDVKNVMEEPSAAKDNEEDKRKECRMPEQGGTPKKTCSPEGPKVVNVDDDGETDKIVALYQKKLKEAASVSLPNSDVDSEEEEEFYESKLKF